MRKSILVLIFCLCVISTRAAQESTKRSLGYYYTQGMAAYEKKDYQAFLDNFKKAYEVAPDHLEAMYLLARAHALTGNKSEAIALLNKVLDLGIFMDMLENADFASIKETAEFKTLRARVAQAMVPIGSSRPGFTVPDKELIPEGIAYDPATETFYLGSINKRKVLSRSKDGKIRDFTSERQDGLWGVLGMKVDARRRVLWVNSAAGREEKEFNGYSGVFKYDLKTGKLIKKYLVDNKQQLHLFNDLAINSQGDIFITDSLGGAIYTISQSKDELEWFVAPGQLLYPNGIDLSNDERKIFVADWSKGISIVNLAARSVAPLPHPQNVTLSGLDGLYFYQGTLIAVQNGPQPERVIQYFLNDKLDRVDSATVIEAGNPRFAIPTTGVIAGDKFYFIANSHINIYKDGILTSVDRLRNTTILMASLKSSSGRGSSTNQSRQ